MGRGDFMGICWWMVYTKQQTSQKEIVQPSIISQLYEINFGVYEIVKNQEFGVNPNRL